MTGHPRASRRPRMVLRLAIAFALASAAAGCLKHNPPPACDGGGEPPPFALSQAAPNSCDPPPPCPDCGGASGDPHVSTYDGRRYDFQTAAEVVGTRSPDGQFEVQWRQEPIGASQTSGVTAVAMRIEGNRVTVVGADAVVRVEGDQVDMAEGDAVVLPSGARIFRLDHQVIVVDSTNDAAVHMQLSRQAMGVLVDPPESDRGQLEGLLGNGDGDRTNDVVLADGTVLDQPTWDQVHPELGETWRVTDATTLFDYDGGAGPDTYWDPTFPTREPRLDDFTADEQAQAEATCREAGVVDADLLESCIFDVLVTGDPAYAELAARQQQARANAVDAQGEAGVAEGAAARWLTELTDVVPRDPRLVDDGAGHVLVTGDSESGGVLVALDATDGTEAWRLVGVEPSCPPVALGGGSIAVVGEMDGVETGPPEGVQSNTLVVVAASTGQVIGGPVIGESDQNYHRLEPCRYGAALAGKTVLVDGRSSLQAFDVSGTDPVWLWSREHIGRDHTDTAAVISDGDRVAVGEQRDDGKLYVVVLDTASGDVVAETEVPGKHFPDPSTLLAFGDRLVVMTNEDAAHGSIIGLALAGDTIDIDWMNPFSPDEADETRRRPPRNTLGADGALIGRVGGPLVAIDATTGAVRWRYDTRNRNSSAPVAVDKMGNVYDATFGGPWIYSVDAEGAPRWELSSDTLFVKSNININAVLSVGPVIGDLVYASTVASGNHPVVVAVSTGG